MKNYLVWWESDWRRGVKLDRTNKLAFLLLVQERDKLLDWELRNVHCSWVLKEPHLKRIELSLIILTLTVSLCDCLICTKLRPDDWTSRKAKRRIVKIKAKALTCVYLRYLLPRRSERAREEWRLTYEEIIKTYQLRMSERGKKISLPSNNESEVRGMD